MNSPRAVVFDMDGLMFNTEDIYWDVGTELLGRRGCEYTRELNDALMGRPQQACFEEMIRERAISGNEEIVVAEKQEKLFDGSFLERLNKDNKRGKGFSLAKDRGEFSWGVVLREGRRTVDLTLDVLMDQLRERIEPDIAPRLFSDS